MNRKEFIKEVERLQKKYGCKLTIEIEENIKIENGKEIIENIVLNAYEPSDDLNRYDECILANEYYEHNKGTTGEFISEYQIVSSYLEEAIQKRTRYIFDVALYETIAEYMVDHYRTSFDRRIGRYQVYVEWESLFSGYSDGCTDIEDGWREVDTNFDSDALEAAINRVKEAREKSDVIRLETENQLRKIA